MKVITDTHALVWALSDPEQLGAEARRAVTECEVLASAANLWELLLKRGKPDALLRDPLAWWQKFVIRTGIPTVGIRVTHVLVLGRLPEIHKDPFDRILIAQSMVEKAALVSKDARLAEYGIELIW